MATRLGKPSPECTASGGQASASRTFSKLDRNLCCRLPWLGRAVAVAIGQLADLRDKARLARGHEQASSGMCQREACRRVQPIRFDGKADSKPDNARNRMDVVRMDTARTYMHQAPAGSPHSTTIARRVHSIPSVRKFQENEASSQKFFSIIIVISARDAIDCMPLQ